MILSNIRGKHHVYTHAERIAAAKASTDYRHRWALTAQDMARQMSCPTPMIEDIEAGRYTAGMARVLGKLLLKDQFKKPRKIRL